MNEQQPNEFQKIISLSDKMLESARQHNWEDVTEIEMERKALMTEFFSNPLALQKGRLANGIRMILEKDREIVRLGSVKREELRDALAKHQRGKDAVEAYSAAG